MRISSALKGLLVAALIGFASLAAQALYHSGQDLAKDALKTAESNLTAAKNRYARVKQLFDSRDATRAQLEAAQQSVEAAEQQLQKAQADVAQASASPVPSAVPGEQVETPEALRARIASLEKQLALARSNVTAAEQAQAAAKAQLERIQTLFERRDATRLQLETEQARLGAAEAQLQQAHAERVKLEAQLEDAQKALEKSQTPAAPTPEPQNQE